MVTGLGYTSIKAQLMTIPPWVISFVLALAAAWVADRYNARGYVSGVTAICRGIGWMTSTLVPIHHYKAQYGCIIVASFGAVLALTPLISCVSCNAPNNKTTGLAVALNCTTTGLGSIVAVWLWTAKQATKSYPVAHKTCAVMAGLCGAFALVLRAHYTFLNKKIREPGTGQREWSL